MQNVFVGPSTVALHDKVTIEDGSGRGMGASGRWSNLFNSLGLTTTDGGTVHRHATTQIIDESGGKDSATAAWLAKFFGVAVTQQPTPAAATGAPAPAASGGIVVILGQDEEKAFLGNPGVGN
jgi:hypothetical protein